jgi:hypothetical protein
MKLAIMQPYLFPYIGYFQLIYAVDKFIILDDVNFINRGWINRNRIIVNGKEHLFSIPLKKISQNKLIMESELSDELWQKKFLKTIEMSYKKAPFFNESFKLISSIVNYKEKNLSLYILNHFQSIFDFLNLEVNIIPSSSVYESQSLKAQEKIIDICKKEKATHYFNPIGGTELYDQNRFLHENIKLNFLKTHEIKYFQISDNFIPWLSIIDVMMFNSPEEIKSFLENYEIL